MCLWTKGIHVFVDRGDAYDYRKEGCMSLMPIKHASFHGLVCLGAWDPDDTAPGARLWGVHQAGLLWPVCTLGAVDNILPGYPATPHGWGSTGTWMTFHRGLSQN